MGSGCSRRQRRIPASPYDFALERTRSRPCPAGRSQQDSVERRTKRHGRFRRQLQRIIWATRAGCSLSENCRKKLMYAIRSVWIFRKKIASIARQRCFPCEQLYDTAQCPNSGGSRIQNKFIGTNQQAEVYRPRHRPPEINKLPYWPPHEAGTPEPDIVFYSNRKSYFRN